MKYNLFLDWDVIQSTLFHLDNASEIVNWPAVICFMLIYYLLVKYKKHPAFYIGLAALIGVFIHF